MTDAKESQRYQETGWILVCIAGLFIGAAFLAFAVSSYFLAIILIVICIAIGNNAITHLEKSADLKPVSPIAPSLEYFSLTLKNGTPLTILIDLQYPIEDHNPHTLERLRARLQRALTENIAFSHIETLPPNPYPYIDAILANSSVPIAAEIGLSQLQLKLVNIKTTPTDSAPGIFLRES
jgi:hypothetical protein